MENQVDIGDQNTQPIGQNPVVQPAVLDKPKANFAAIFAVGLVCSVVFGVSGYFLGKQSPKSAQVTDQYPSQPTPVSTTSPTIQVTAQALQEGKEISIEGIYVKNTTDSELEPNTADGASYQVMNTKEYGQIKIITGGFRMNCLAKEIYQSSKGESVEVYGKVVSDPSGQFFNGHVLSVCLSDQYYIKKR